MFNSLDNCDLLLCSILGDVTSRPEVCTKVRDVSFFFIKATELEDKIHKIYLFSNKSIFIGVDIDNEIDK